MKKQESDRTPKDLLNDLHALVVEAEAMMSQSVSEHSSAAIRNLRARYDSAQERFLQAYDGARTNVIVGAKYTDETIRTHPYQAIAIATGVGILVGALFLNRKQREE